MRRARRPATCRAQRRIRGRQAGGVDLLRCARRRFRRGDDALRAPHRCRPGPVVVWRYVPDEPGAVDVSRGAVCFPARTRDVHRSVRHPWLPARLGHHCGRAADRDRHCRVDMARTGYAGRPRYSGPRLYRGHNGNGDFAVGARGAGGSNYIIAGAVLFFLSDLSVAALRIQETSYATYVAGLPAYYAAQVCLALSIATNPD